MVPLGQLPDAQPFNAVLAADTLEQLHPRQLLLPRSDGVATTERRGWCSGVGPSLAITPASTGARSGCHSQVVDDTGFPKDGPCSVGVQRQYCGTLGKRANCQLGVSVNAITEHASCPLDWRLFVPESWDEEVMAARRAACHLPDEVRHRPKWQLVLDMLAELAMAAGQQAWVELVWRRGSRGLQRGRFLALRVRPAGVTPRRLARQ